jgi:hypothetical protein
VGIERDEDIAKSSPSAPGLLRLDHRCAEIGLQQRLGASGWASERVAAFSGCLLSSEEADPSDYDIVSDTSKARRFGFHDLVDTEEMFLRMFSDFRRDRIIP